jgi:PII-like signaling protein
MGFGASSHLHTAKILQLSGDLPIVVEIVDDAAKIDAFWAEAAAMMDGGLATTEPVRVLAYGPKKAKA